MTNDVVLCVVLVPVLGSFFLPLLGSISKPLRNWAAFLMVAASLAGSLSLIPSVFYGAPVDAAIGGTVNIGFDVAITFHADRLAVFVAIVSSLVSSIILLYSMRYIAHYEAQNEYYFMVVLFLGGMMGLVFASNLIPLYVFWEITAIASWRLIGFFRGRDHILKADKAFLVTVFGALAMLLGFITIYQQHGTFDLAKLHGQAISDLAVGLILIGMLSKSATLPFHTWLPDAGVAPSPVTALLHAAVLVKIGVYVFARIFIVTFALTPVWQDAVLYIAAASALVSAGAALIDTDLKRIVAYSTISQIGFIFLGFAAGAEIGMAGALLYILMHGLAKAGLFLCAGIVEQKTHNKDITRMGGLIKVMPVTAVSFLLCSFSVMGIPPFGGFFSKYMVISGSVAAGQTWIGLVFLVGACMTIVYLLRVFTMVFLGESRSEHSLEEAREGSLGMVASVAALAAMSLVGGILINTPSQYAYLATMQMLGK